MTKIKLTTNTIKELDILDNELENKIKKIIPNSTYLNKYIEKIMEKTILKKLVKIYKKLSEKDKEYNYDVGYIYHKLDDSICIIYFEKYLQYISKFSDKHYHLIKNIFEQKKSISDDDIGYTSSDTKEITIYNTESVYGNQIIDTLLFLCLKYNFFDKFRTYFNLCNDIKKVDKKIILENYNHFVENDIFDLVNDILFIHNNKSNTNLLNNELSLLHDICRNIFAYYKKGLLSNHNINFFIENYYINLYLRKFINEQTYNIENKYTDEVKLLLKKHNKKKIECDRYLELPNDVRDIVLDYFFE